MDKLLYKIEILLLKVIPFVLATFQFIYTISFIIGMTIPIIAEFASISIIPLLFLYISSYTFKFCEYHRMPLHYIVFNNILNSIDYHFQIALSDYRFIILHSILFGIFAIGCCIMKILNKKI